MSHPQWLHEEGQYQLVGELTRDTVPDIWKTILQWKPEQSELELSLAKAGRIDSAGMALLIQLIEHAKKLNCHIMLSFVPKELHTLFQLSNVDGMLAKNIKS
ncbi:lipid asymmetry maintenance protein MlaB [Vibrio hannami]|uniref:STAS domain-containing protein n=1 Tax=Vibrio hannami TaxID=2717094 RepID=UPI00240EB888|nr:lipid asymmetry maintenance protein MlaB [Vibrio hannami]MDG3084760.1 lipid asymmetry maintenance protein MlaB [Vibrio hannami]